MRKTLTILVPVYFNGLNLPTTIPTLLAVLDTMQEIDGQLCFVDDGSGDNSFLVLREWAEKDARIKIVRLVRNFGAYPALLAGIDHAKTDATIIIMADLQDPPELIPKMVEAWKQGSPIVIAERHDREDPLVNRAFAWAFWNYIHRYALSNVPKGGFDFILFDRQVADALRMIRPTHSHFMLEILWTGYPYITMMYTRKERKMGKSKWTMAKKIKLFIDSGIAFSYAPIAWMRWMVVPALVSLLIGITFLVGVQSAMRDLVFMGLVCFWLAVSFVSLPIMGEYVWRILDMQRGRPRYLVRETVNIDSVHDHT